MTSGPERPDAEKGDQRSPDAMDLGLGIRVVRFPGEQCGQDDSCRSWRNAPHRGPPPIYRHDEIKIETQFKQFG